MAESNLLVTEEPLLARKGEAAPADRIGSGFGHSCISSFPHNGSKQRNSKKGKSVERDPSTLASLIQRRAYAPEFSSDAKSIVVSEHGLHANWREPKSQPEIPCPSERQDQWKKLTFRVRHDQYVRLKNLSGLWSTTYQSILEKAVAYYIDEATTSKDFDWKV